MVLSLLLVLSIHAQSQPSQDRFRPAIHFAPKTNWTNDPCGLYFLDGLYHIFFQYNPEGNTWGHMSWGHASSRDLRQWTEHPVALAEEPAAMMFTGSGVVDAANSSGLCPGKGGCPILVYTGHQTKTADRPRREHQNLAIGDRAGMRWTKYAQNPVLDEKRAEFRDPKVFWHQATKRWIMVVALADEHKVGFYGSADLKAWTKLSEFGPAGTVGPNWECPEFFELSVEGSRETRWILKIGIGDKHVAGGSGEQYFVGTFDGTKFVNENPATQTLWFDYGRDCYCTLAWGNQPAGRSIKMLGWMNNWSYANAIPTAPFRGQMTIPRDVSLRRTAQGLRLVQQPILGGERGARRVAIEEDSLAGLRSKMATVELPRAFELIVDASAPFTLRLVNSRKEAFLLGYDAVRNEWFTDRTAGGLTAFHEKFASRSTATWPADKSGRLDARVVVDASSVELFAARGEVVLTNLVFPNEPWTRIEMDGPTGLKAKLRVEPR